MTAATAAPLDTDPVDGPLDPAGRAQRDPIRTAARSGATGGTAARARLVLIRPAPRREPPFDDELAAAPAGSHDPWLPFADPVPARPRRPRAGRPLGVPEPAGWARRLLVGLVEAADGRRGLAQLHSMFSPAVARGLNLEFERNPRGGSRHWLRRCTVGSVLACEPADGIAEVSAVLDTGRRARAVALRLEFHAGRWRCVRLQLG